ncbi:MAG TPA: hypothetical protein VK995_06565 [Oceanipulchritudo sp.]|nr:hypothetical protein [Oceanipulchritudo sp.]
MMVLAGCATPPPVEQGDPRAYLAGELGYIRDGAITRSEILLRLGSPAASFEDGRILTYEVVPDGQGGWRPGDPVMHEVWPLRIWPEGACSLVLVFGSDGLLERHNLVVPPAPPQS